MFIDIETDKGEKLELTSINEFEKLYSEYIDFESNTFYILYHAYNYLDTFYNDVSNVIESLRGRNTIIDFCIDYNINIETILNKVITEPAIIEFDIFINKLVNLYYNYDIDFLLETMNVESFILNVFTM